MASLPDGLAIVKSSVYDQYGLNLEDLELGKESAEYEACSSKLNGYSIQHRTSKTTPTKTGQFTAIWKRNQDGVTAPFDVSDDIDFMIITSKRGSHLGQFIFPKAILVEQGVISQHEKGGKRGIRVYPPWDIVSNKQAERSQNWQIRYFLNIGENGATDWARLKKLLMLVPLENK